MQVKSPALYRLLDEPQPLVRDPEIIVPDRDRGTDIDLADKVGAELLQRRIGIERLVAAWLSKRTEVLLVITSLSVKSLATAPPISRAIATPVRLDRVLRDGVCGCWEAVGKWPAGATVEGLA